MKSHVLRFLISSLFLLGTITSFSQSAGKLFSQGKDAAEAGKTDEAIALFTKVLEMKPKDDEVMIERAKAYEKKNELEKAIVDYDNALNIKQDNKLYLKVAALKIGINKWPQALFDLDRVLEDDKGNIEAYEQKAWCLINTKKFADALATCETALLKNQYNHRLHYLKGMSKDSLKDYAAAVTEYQRAVTIMNGLTEKNQPQFKPYYTNLAMAQTKAGMYDDAIKNYTIASKLDPKDSISPKNYRIFYYRSFPQFMKNDFGPATDDLDKALSMNDKDKECIYQRALIAIKTSKYQSAINDFTNYIKLDDKNAEVFSYRAKCYLESNNYKEAIKDYSSAVGISNKAEDVKALADT